MDDYAVVNVGPSVVPNPYLPSFRIYSYNTTGGKGASGQEKRRHGHRRGSDGNNATCQSDKYADTWRCHLNREWHSDAKSPSRSNRQWTPLGYAQVGYYYYCVWAHAIVSVLHAGAGTGRQDADAAICARVRDAHNRGASRGS